MKVDLNYFTNAEMYIRRINHCSLEKLDLSELFEGDLTKAKEEFSIIGLNNMDFIRSDWIDKKYPEIKRKFIPNNPLRGEL